MSVKQGVYWIRNLRWKHKVLDLSGGNLATGTKIENLDQRDTLNALLNQLWIVEPFGSRGKHLIRNAHSGLVLDLQEADPDNGTPIVCWNQNGGANQQWRVEWSRDEDGTAYYHVINVATGKAVSHDLDDAVNFVVGWTVDGGSKQLWAFTPFAAPLPYRLRVKSTSRVLDLAGASPDNGTLALASDRHTAIASRKQLWRLPIKPGSEGYTIQNLETGTVADLAASDNGITGWGPHGGRNQQWKMKTLADGYQEITNVAGGLVMEAKKDDEAKRVGGEQPHGGETQRWFLDSVPSPGPGWVLIQNGASGKFLTSDPRGRIGTSNGPATVFDESVQWRFLERGHTGIYALVNRATGAFLRQLPAWMNSISLAKTADNEPEARDLWILENYHGSNAGLVSIISKQTDHTLDHYASQRIEALDKRTDFMNRAWKIMPTNDWITSFALVNGQTGHPLAARPTGNGTTISAEHDVKSFHAQWVFRKIADGPLFAIQNKATNLALGGAAARWQLVVSRGKYFALLDTKTKRYLGVDEKGEPNFWAPDAADRRQSWELVSDRTTPQHSPNHPHDVLYLDDDLISALLPLLATIDPDESERISETLGGARGAKKPAKDASDWSLPTRARVPTHATDNAVLRQLLHALIDRWEWDDADAGAGDQGSPLNHPAQTLLTLDLATAEAAVTGQRLPPSLRRVFAANSSSNPVLRLDRLGWITLPIPDHDNDNNNDDGQQQQRYAHLQGRWGGGGGRDVYFAAAVPVGVGFGREQIRGILRDSLERSTAVVVTPATCMAPGGGPAFERDAGVGGSGSAWVGWARALLSGEGVRRSEL